MLITKLGSHILGFGSDFLKCWGGCSNWSRRKENENKLGRGSQTRLLTRSLVDVMFSLLGGGQKPTGVGGEAAPTLPECVSTGVRADRTPCRGELTRVPGCDRTWRCHGRDRAWRGHQQRVCVDRNVVCARVCVSERGGERERIGVCSGSPCLCLAAEAEMGASGRPGWWCLQTPLS